MKISDSSLKDLTETGVYKITNLINQKVYIGSTKKNFISRYKSHYEKLRTNNHKGYAHLQNSVNKYGIANFEFSILEICDKEKTIEREKFWISKYEACNREKGYNSNENPFSSPFSNKDIRAKAGKTVSERYKLGLIKPNSGTFKSGKEPWNKGIKYQSTNHLKVPKRNKPDRTAFLKTVREKQQPIEVFDLEDNSLGKYKCYQDIQNDESLHQYMILINKKGRNGYNPHYLSRLNINYSCRTGRSYKGLIFKTISPQ